MPLAHIGGLLFSTLESQIALFTTFAEVIAFLYKDCETSLLPFVHPDTLGTMEVQTSVVTGPKRCLNHHHQSPCRIMMVRNSSDRSFSMAVVRSVSTPTFTTDSQVEEESKRKAIAVGPLMQQDYFVGMVCLGMLEVYGRVHGTFKRYRASGITGTRSWHSIERILDDPQVTIITMGNLLNGYGKT